MLRGLSANSEVDVVCGAFNDPAALRTDFLPKGRLLPVSLNERSDINSPAMFLDPVDQLWREPHRHLRGAINLAAGVLSGASTPSLGFGLFLS